MQTDKIEQSIFGKALSYKGRLAELAVGLMANKLMVWAFDFFLYPFIIYRLGIIKGGIVMTFLSFLACIGTMKFYDWSKHDWLGIEAIKGMKDYDGDMKAGRITSWFLKKSEPVAFFFLSIWYDPFIVTAYLRHGANKFNGMNSRDWKIFMGSLIFSNAYWTLAVYMGISLVEWVWKAITS